MRWFLRKKAPVTPIAAGQQWQHRNYVDESPWPHPRPMGLVEVLDAKEGWVRYTFLPRGGTFSDERMKEDTFRYVYRPYDARPRLSLSAGPKA